MPNPAIEAFDRHALVYDRAFASGKVREQVWAIADRLFLPGMTVLDAGCGTGEDAVHLAERGVKITAVDASSAMIAQLRSKARGGIRSDVADMTTYAPEAPLDGVISNFGALNCVEELDWLLRLPIRPGGHQVLTLMGRFYPLEFAVSLLKGRPRDAFRRFRRCGEATLEGVRIPVYYHSLRQMRAALRRKFDLIEVQGICSLTPAPNLAHLRRFRALRLLEPADRRLCSHRPTASFSDHYVSVWRRRET